MSYIGKQPQVGNYVKLDSITCSSTNTYNLLKDSVAFVPESALHMLVSLNGVIQSPLSSFSVSGSTITFLPSSGTLSSSDTIDFILVLGNTLDIGTPSDSTVTNAKTNFVTTSSSAGLQIKGDNTTAGALQLNCEQNSHGIKLQSPAHSANQSYTLKFPTGNVTAGKVLKVDSVSGSGTTGIGQLTFGESGTRKLIKSVTASNASSIDFVHGSSDVVLDTTYKRYEITFDNLVPSSAGPYFFVLLSTNSGSSYGGNNDYNGVNFKYGSNGSTHPTQAQAMPNGLFHDQQIDSSATNGGVSGTIDVSGIGTSHKQLIRMCSYHFGHNDYYIESVAVGSLTNTTAVNGIRLYFNSGNIASGTAKLFGVL